MFVPVVASGLLLTIIGLAGISHYVPLPDLSIINSTSVENLNATCSQGNSCEAAFRFNNINQTMTVQIVIKLKNSLSQTKALYTISNVIIPSGQSQTIRQPLGTLVSGAYSVEVFALNNLGVAISVPVTRSFATGTAQITIPTGLYISLSPPASSSLGDVGIGGTTYTYPFGVQVTAAAATPADKGIFQCWVFLTPTTTGAGVCKSTQNPYTFTIDDNFVLTYMSAPPTSSVYFEVTPLHGDGGNINPSTVQKVYQSSAVGPTTITFIAVPTGLARFDGWVLNDQSAGSDKILNITYSLLQQRGFSAFVTLYAKFTSGQMLIIIDSPVNPGKATLSPTIGNHEYVFGSKVTLNATNIASGYVFRGWTVDGLTLTKALNYTLIMDQFHVAVPVVNSIPTGCRATSPTSYECVTTTTSTSVIGTSRTTITQTLTTTTSDLSGGRNNQKVNSGWILLGISAIITVAGIRIKREDVS